MDSVPHSYLCHLSQQQPPLPQVMCCPPSRTPAAIFLLLLFPGERCLCHTGCLDRDICHLERYAAGVTSVTEDTSTTMLCWALSLAFQGRRVTALSIARVLPLPSFYHPALHYQSLQTPQRVLPPTHRKTWVANASDSLCLDFILHKSPFHLGRRKKRSGESNCIPWKSPN